ncbi:MAG: efflux RND transporter periplasmic adaptor subunit [Phycisphaerales bacterium]|nr:MAG: efflux RND transporter periplasmic adaptor subunit [Phycisphaerales bacterium]
MTENRRKTGRVAKQRRPASRTANGFLHALLALLIVLLGIAATITFIKLKKPPERAEKDVQAPLVKVEQLRVSDIPMVVRGYGVVNPKVEVDIVPEVAGRVVSIHPEFKVGGLIRANDRILQIDPRDHESAVRQAAAGVEDAKVKLDTEQAEADVARKEWSDLHPGVEPTSPLVLREPQIRKARAALESAEAQLATAKLRLERTSLSLPFDALIISEKVDLGQYVVTGQSLAKAYGTGAVEIEVPLEDDELAWFDVFENSIFSDGNRGAAKTTPAEVRANFAGAEHTWQGRVVRTTGQVDRTSRMVFIVVEVSNPLRVSDGRPPLLPGVFAEVLIEGKTLSGAVAVPRDAIREGNQVWLVNGNRLYIRPLDIVRVDKDFAYVISGVQDEALVVTSSLDTVVDGMEVRLQSETATGAGQAGQDTPEPNGREEIK